MCYTKILVRIIARNYSTAVQYIQLSNILIVIIILIINDLNQASYLHYNLC